MFIDFVCMCICVYMIFFPKIIYISEIGKHIWNCNDKVKIPKDSAKAKKIAREKMGNNLRYIVQCMNI